jgi:DNA-binding beta-propeller fold protein YncE
VCTASACAVVAVVVLWSSPALAAREHTFVGSFGEEGAGAGQFSNPAGVAVNEASGDVYVVDRGHNRVEHFTAERTFVGQFDGSAAPTGAFSSPEAIAIDNSTNPLDPSAGDVYVADTGHNVIDKFDAAGTYLGQITETTGSATLENLDGVAVDPNGQLWVYQNGQIDAFDDSLANEFLSSRSSPFGTSPGFAVDSEDNLYVNRGSLVVAKLNSAGEVLKEEVDNEPTSAVAVDETSNDAYLDNVTQVRSFTPGGTSIEQFGSGHLNSGSGIAVNASAEQTVYVADSSADTVDVFALEPIGEPAVEDQSVTNVSADSATFGAEVNPHGAETEFHFEYGRCTSLSACASSGYEHSVPAPDRAIGSEFGPQAVSAHAQELTPSAAYHVRAFAHNAFGTKRGEERTFTTQPAQPSTRLPDGRQWEMVSPPHKEGAALGAIGEGIIQAAADGNAISDWSSSPIEEGPESTYYEVANFFGRGPGGWVAKTIAPPHSESGPPPVGNGGEYRMFSEDLSKGILQPFGPATPLVPGVTESTAYVRTDYLNGNPGEQCTSNCYMPLVSATNVPAGTKYGNEPASGCEADFCGPQVIGANRDLSDLVLSSGVALTETPLEGKQQGLYEWSAGKLALLSLLPPGETNESGGPVATANTGGVNQVQRHMVSDDGTRVLWLGESSRTAVHLYLWDATSKETIRLDTRNSGVPEDKGGVPLYMTANSDLSRILFLDEERLTEDSTAGGEREPDLYEYNVNAPPGSRLTDLSVDTNTGEHADVKMVSGASEDGSYVYFSAPGALAPGAKPGGCGINSPKPGETQLCNLYVRHGGVTTFIAGLSADDFPEWSVGLDSLPVRVSPDGQWLAFMSNRPQTGDDNIDASSGQPDEEVYVYDAPTNKLVCASCNPTGARPAGIEYAKQSAQPAGVFDPRTWIASNVPPWTRLDLGETRYQSRFLSDSGRLFFDSHDALSPQDVNGTDDVYEYEPPGVGDCVTSSSTYSVRSGGCLALVSSGTSGEESAFLDASETGSDVFFLTSARLLPADFDNAYDIYDARECGSPSRCLPAAAETPPPCSTGDSCKPSSTPQPPIFGAPASATFSGAGNLTGTPSTHTAKPPSRKEKLALALHACHKKHNRKKRRVCERKANRLFGAKSSRTTQKGASR